MVGGTWARTGLPPALTTAAYNANNQQTTFGTNKPTYDANGNFIKVGIGASAATYTWNVRDQLTSIRKP